jgi:hypothetical protein
MKEIKIRNVGWSDSDLARAHRARGIGILLNDDEDLWHYLFHKKTPIHLRDEREIFGNQFKKLNQEEQILVFASMDLWNSTGDVPLWRCLWDLDYTALIRLIRSSCHLREIQLKAIQRIMNDYIGPYS